MSVLATIRRDLVQYGLTPDRIAFRLSGRDAPRVLANSVPKAGTNLLIRALYLMYPLHRKLMRTLVSKDPSERRAVLQRLKRGEIAAAHVEYSAGLSELLLELGILQAMLVRDPRDIAVSHYHYTTYQDRAHFLHGYYTQCLFSDDERLLASISGFPGNETSKGKGLRPLAERLQGFLDWESDPRCLALRFEDLIGGAGGGDDEQQMRALKRIRNHLGLSLGDADLHETAGELYSSESRTFRRGQIGTWRDHWSATHDEAAKRTGLSALIEKLGYPAF